MPKKSRRMQQASQKNSNRSGKPSSKLATRSDSSGDAVAGASSRKPKKASTLRDADGIQELAEELRGVADTIDGYANVMRRMRIENIRPLTGNWDLAVAKLRDVINKQILARLLVEADKRGYEAHEIFRK